MGVVNAVVGKRDWLDAALELARRIAKRPPIAAAARQAGGAGRRRDLALGRARPGAAPVRARDGDRGPGRGHAGLPREAQAGVQGAMSAEHLRARARRRVRPRGVPSPRRARSGERAGTERLGASLYELEPGKANCPVSLARGERGTAARARRHASRVRTPEGTREAGAGEVVAFPRGERGAHQLIARGDEPARFLMMSERSSPDICRLPGLGQDRRAQSGGGRRHAPQLPRGATRSTTGTARSRRDDELPRARVRGRRRARGLPRPPRAARPPGRLPSASARACSSSSPARRRSRSTTTSATRSC